MKVKQPVSIVKRVAIYASGFLAGLAIWAVLKLFVLPEAPEDISFYQDIDNVATGVLFVSGNEGLFVQRKKDQLWLFPGGQFDSNVDMDHFAAMMRIATEALGYLPQHELQEELSISYQNESPKSSQTMQFSLFLATVKEDVKREFLPRVSEAYYVKAEWIPLGTLDSRLDGMHPVVRSYWRGEMRAKIMVLASL